MDGAKIGPASSPSNGPSASVHVAEEKDKIIIVKQIHIVEDRVRRLRREMSNASLWAFVLTGMAADLRGIQRRRHQPLQRLTKDR